MKIIVVKNQKGGTGKSTLVAGLAAAFHESGLSVAVADADPQRSVSEYLEGVEGRPIPVYAADDAAVLAQLPTVDAFEVMVMDTPGHLAFQDLLTAAVEVADFVLIPMEPAPWSITPTMETITGLTPVTTPHAVVLNRVDMRAPARAQHIATALTEAGQPVLSTWVRELKAHQDAIGARVLITESRAPRASDAADDMRQLAHEITAHLGAS